MFMSVFHKNTTIITTK